MPGFLQELFIAQVAGQLTLRLTDGRVNPQDANYCRRQSLTARVSGLCFGRPRKAPG
jgi:hypothetical protein